MLPNLLNALEPIADYFICGLWAFNSSPTRLVC